MRYFRKSLPKNPVLGSDGQPIRFALVGDGYGLAALDETQDAQRIADLEAWAKRGQGGVIELSAAEAEALKKKPVEPAPSLLPHQKLRLFNPGNPFGDAVGVAARAASAAVAAEPSALNAEAAAKPETAVPASLVGRGRKVRSGAPKAAAASLAG